MSGKFQSDYMGRAVRGKADIFQCSLFNISDISSYGSGSDELVALFKVAQHTITDAQFAPEISVYIVDI